MQLQPVGVLEVVEPVRKHPCSKRTRSRSRSKWMCLPDLPPVRGDAGLLRDVLQNLIDNAIQYTPSGGRIRISAEEKKREVVIARCRYRHWYSTFRPGTDFRALLSRGRGAFARSGRHRPGLVDRQAHRRSPRRPVMGGKRSGRPARSFPSRFPWFPDSFRVFPKIHARFTSLQSLVRQCVKSGVQGIAVFRDFRSPMS